MPHRQVISGLNGKICATERRRLGICPIDKLLDRKRHPCFAAPYANSSGQVVSLPSSRSELPIVTRLSDGSYGNALRLVSTSAHSANSLRAIEISCVRAVVVRNEDRVGMIQFRFRR